MHIAQQFCDAQQWARIHFGAVQLDDVYRQQRVCTLVASWVRLPGASVPQLGAGSAYASKAAYQLLGGVAVTPNILQGPHRQLVHPQLQ